MADKVIDMVKNVLSESETILNRGIDNPYISTAIKVFLGLYAAFAAPQLPKSLANLMDHTLVRIAFAFVIVFMATRDPSIALMIAVAFIITLQTANKFRLYDTSLSNATAGQVSWLPSVNESVPQEAEVNTQEMLEGVNDNATANQSLLTDNLNNVVEGMEGADVPESIKNVSSVEEENEPTSFTSNNQFNNAQTNNVPEADQDSCVKTWNNQHCIQGLEKENPNGYSGSEHMEL
mgnify:CR=1